jgi:hypothetical protein
MLSQCQRPDKPSVMINGVKYVVKLNDVMYQVSNHKQTTLPLALIDRGTLPTVVSPGQTHGLLISPCALFIFKVLMTT